MAQDKDERRGFPRLPIQGTLVLEKNHEEYPIKLLDISKGGACFESSQKFAPDTLVLLLLDHFPVDIPLRALVAWSRPADGGLFEHGVEFINLPRAESVLVRDFIDEKAEEDPSSPE